MEKGYQCFVNVSIKSKTSFTRYYKFEFFFKLVSASRLLAVFGGRTNNVCKK